MKLDTSKIKPLPEGADTCYWCWQWKAVNVPATARYLSAGESWVSVCPQHLEACGPVLPEEA